MLRRVFGSFFFPFTTRVILYFKWVLGMEVSAMAQGFYILIILLLLTLSEIQCKASKWYFFIFSK